MFVRMNVIIFLVELIPFGFNSSKGFFKLSGMTAPLIHLKCDDFELLKVSNHVIGEGAVKKVFLANWQNHTVALNVLGNGFFLQDFLSGLKVLELLNPSPLVVQLVGICETQNMFVTEYHKNGDASNLLKILKDRKDDCIEKRLKLCINYVQILEFIHSDSNGKRVMCDSNDLMKTLSQYLLDDDLNLILNDADALPSVLIENKVKCGNRQLFGTFVAPEQLWPFTKQKFNNHLMPKYDEKTDIWKVPDVCHHFLSTAASSKMIMYKLFEIHKHCKNHNPALRPSAQQIKEVYSKVLNSISTHHDL